MNHVRVEYVLNIMCIVLAHKVLIQLYNVEWVLNSISIAQISPFFQIYDIPLPLPYKSDKEYLIYMLIIFIEIPCKMYLTLFYRGCTLPSLLQSFIHSDMHTRTKISNYFRFSARANGPDIVNYYLIFVFTTYTHGYIHFFWVLIGHLQPMKPASLFWDISKHLIFTLFQLDPVFHITSTSEVPLTYLLYTLLYPLHPHQFCRNLYIPLEKF